MVYKYFDFTLILPDTGIFLLNDNSATGKTYLGKKLTEFTRGGVLRGLHVEYNPTLNYVELLKTQYDVILLDRADLYLTAELVALLKLQKGLVLLDYKHPAIEGFSPYIVYLSFDKKGIYVKEKIHIRR